MYTKSLTKKLGGANFKGGMLMSKFGSGGGFSKPVRKNLGSSGYIDTRYDINPYRVTV